MMDTEYTYYEDNKFRRHNVSGVWEVWDEESKSYQYVLDEQFDDI